MTNREKVLFIIANEGYSATYLGAQTGMTPEKVHDIYKKVWDKGLYRQMREEAEPLRLADPFRRRATFRSRFKGLIATKKKDMSIKEIAADMGLSVTTVYTYLEQDRRPRTGRIEKIATYFNVTPSWLMGENK